jgi:predicted transcriptional regulator
LYDCSYIDNVKSKIQMANTVKKVKIKKLIDPAKYVNTDTGEDLTSEVKDGGFEFYENTEMVTITSDNFTILDSTALIFLRKHLNRSELGSISIIAEDLRTPLNIVYNASVPHTNESLQSALEILSRSTFNSLIRKLMKLGVLYQIKGNIKGKIRVIYMMNPFVARKRKQLDSKLIEVFKEFNKS